MFFQDIGADMIVVKIELWRKGNPKDVTLLGVIKIALCRVTKDLKHGDYDVELSHCGKYLGWKKGCWKKGKVENHLRNKSPHHLVYKALKAALKLK